MSHPSRIGKTSAVRWNRTATSFGIGIVLILSPGPARSQQALPPGYQLTVIVDVDNLDDRDRATIIESLGSVIPTDRWPTIRVKPGTSLFKLVNERYRYYDSVFPNTTASIGRLIKEANDLTSIDAVKAGQQLRVPPLPVRPYTIGARGGLTQFLNVESGVLKIRPVSVVAGPFIMPAESSALPLGSTWAIKMTSAEFEGFLGSLPQAMKGVHLTNNIYFGPTTETAVLHLPTGATVPDPASASLPAPLPEVRALTPARAPKYYVIDFFTKTAPNDCPHGTKVLEVVRQALHAYGADQLQDNVVPIEVDFYADKQEAARRIRTFIRRFSAGTQELLSKSLAEFLRSERNPAEPMQVPLLYLAAIFSQIIEGGDASVASSSFWIRFDGHRVLPPAYTPDSDVNLFSAVLDDALPVEDAQTIEPIRTYWDYRMQYGVALVGAEKAPGVPLGMWSRTGDGVTSLASGYPLRSRESCFKPTEVGTSFATPVIAVQLFLARAFWNEKHLIVSAREAKIRLLLAAEVTPGYVGHYASAGIPRLERLLRATGPHAITVDGRVVSLKAASGFIEVADEQGGPSDHFNFKRGDAGFSGLQIIGNQAYVFREAGLKWQPAKITAMKLTVDDGIPFTDLASLASQFKVLFIL